MTMTWNTHLPLKLCAALALCVMMGSCNGLFEDIYDKAPADSTFEEGFRPVEGSPRRYTLMLDARNYEEWIYVDFDGQRVERKSIPRELTGDWDGRSGWTYHLVEGDRYTYLSSIKTDTQAEPVDWDMAFHHFDVRTRGGSALMTEYRSIDELPPSSEFANAKFTPDEWNTTQVITDLEGMLAYHIGYQNAYVNTVLSTWASMDFSTPPPVYSSTGRVYVVRMANGEMAAMHLKNYMSQAGTKGFLTIDVLYPY